METLRYLIPYFLKIAFSFFFAAIVWWILALLLPGITLKSIFLSTFDKTGTSTLSSLLPSPRRFGEIMGRGENNATMPKVYVHGPAYNGYGNDTNNQYSYASYNYVTYTGTGRVITDVNGNPVTQNAQSNNGKATSTNQNSGGLTGTRSLYVRNLSIYENGHIYTGLAFIGEARSNMFKEGKFPIAVLDQAGKLVGVSAAVATNDWAVAGWTRFETKIFYVLPNNTPCTMIFEEALTQAEKAARRPLQIPMQVKCN